MGIKQESPVIELLNLFDTNDFRPRLPQILSLFSEGARYRYGLSRDPIVGRQAIGAELTRQAGEYTDCECEILTLVSDEQYVVTERIDHVTLTRSGLTIHNPLLAIFHINQQGLISTWTEYWDALALSVSMGVDPAQMAVLMGPVPAPAP